MRAAARILGEGGHHLWGASHTNYFLLTPTSPPLQHMFVFDDASCDG
jgi:hypothetical protein